jgi:hypothetical protein
LRAIVAKNFNQCRSPAAAANDRNFLWCFHLAKLNNPPQS